MYKVNELFGSYTNANVFPDVRLALKEQCCPYRSDGNCTKNRKSEPEVMIGTCSLCFDNVDQPLIICPERLTENNSIFIDCLEYLNYDEECELYLIPEVTIPVGHVDYMLVSYKNETIYDFIGIELQTMDTTGTIWPSRQAMLRDNGYNVALTPTKNVGVNWKMTAKTILAQIVQKTQIFDSIGHKLVLVCQTPLYEYMKREFNFQDMSDVDPNNLDFPTFFHAYDFLESADHSHVGLTLKIQTCATLEAVEKIMLTTIDHDQALDEICATIKNKTSYEYAFVRR